MALRETERHKLWMGAALQLSRPILPKDLLSDATFHIRPPPPIAPLLPWSPRPVIPGGNCAAYMLSAISKLFRSRLKRISTEVKGRWCTMR